MTPEEIDDWFDQLEVSFETRYRRLLQALPGAGPDGRLTSDLQADVWMLWQEAKRGLELRREKARRPKTGPKSDLREQVIICAVDYLLSVEATVGPERTWWVGDTMLRKNDILDGTLRELEKYDERFMGDASEGNSKTVRNWLSTSDVQFIIYCEVRQLRGV